VEELFLEVSVNRVDTKELGHFLRARGRLYVDAATLDGLGLSLPGRTRRSPWMALDDLPGLHIAYQESAQRVELMAPVSLLSRPPAQLGYVAPPPPRIDPDTRAPGLLLNYDIYGQGDGTYRSVSGWNELRLFGLGPGIWRSSSILGSAHGRTRNDTRFVRLDSSWEWDFPASMVSVVVGDTYSGALDWTRATRFGGVRVSRAFNLQPYRVTVPLASYAGEATLPSTVDMFINGIRQSQQAVLPGRFQIDSAPMINGLGQAQVVITDITGRSRVVDFSLYNDAQLLQRGLSDWSFEAGKVRLGYGVRSFSYASETMGTGTYRYGVSDALTVETHAEAMRGFGMGGGGGLLRLGRAGGVLGASYAISRSDRRDGRQWGTSYEWQGDLFNFRLSTLRVDSGFRDIASLEGAGLPRRTDQVFAGLNLGRGQLGASYLRQELAGLPGARYLSLSWSQTTRHLGNLSLSISRDIDEGTGSTAYVYWSLPLGDQRQLWGSAQHQRSGNTITAGATRPIPGDEEGWGWRVQASAGDQAGEQAELGQLTRYGEWRAGVLRWRGDGRSTTSGYVDLSGGVLLMNGSLFAMRRANDAFVLVSTDGVPDVPVMLENRHVGNTNSKGQLLVTNLNAWQNNDISIDPLVLSADVNVERERRAVVPPNDSGVVARFPMRKMTAVVMTLRAPNGQWIPAGTTAALRGGGQSSEVTLGYDGEVYMQSPPPGAQLIVPLTSGDCVVALPSPLPDSGWVDLGEVPCR